MKKFKKRVPAALTAGILAVSLMSAGLSPLTSFALEDGLVSGSEAAGGFLSREEEPAVSSPEYGSAESSGIDPAGEAAGITEDSRASAGMDSAGAAAFASAGGWFESMYAELTGVSASDVTAVSWTGTADGANLRSGGCEPAADSPDASEFSAGPDPSGPNSVEGSGIDDPGAAEISGSLDQEALRYLVREMNPGTEQSFVRIDIPGLSSGTYTLSVTAAGQTIEKTGVTVYPYDRSGYAHFNYTEGVGAYNDDGTLKSDAIVLYVTDENKNAVTLTYGGKTVTGIGNILNSAGQNPGGEAKANTNQGIIQLLSKNNIPLLVRFIGTVSDSGLYKRATKAEPYDQSQASLINGLTAFSSRDYGGGGQDDNGHSANMKGGKSITLEGIGNDAVIDGWGFGFSQGKGFEVRNLTFMNTPEDAVGMDGSQSGSGDEGVLTSPVERCWIHNNEFYCPRLMYSADPEGDKYEGDGSMDFKRGQYLTCSYNFFEGCHKTNLIGGDDGNLQFNLTFHHNHWFWCQSRSPFSRRGNIHIYNNLFDMQTNVCQDARANGFNFSEYNLFYDSKNPYSTQSGAVIKSYHDSVSGRSQTRAIDELYIVSSRSEDVPNSCRYAQGNVDYSSFETDSALSYIPEKDYVIQEDFTELRKTLAAYCGAMKENPVQPGYVEEDSYSKILRTVGDNVNKITALPYTSAPGDLGGGVWAFEIEDPANVTLSYGEEKGVLVNAAGENLLEGDGTAVDIPEGKYMIRPVQFSPRTYEDTDEGVFSYGNISVVSLNITSSQTNRRITFDYNYDGSPGPVSVRFIPGAVIPDLNSFIPAGFSRDGYDLKGLYTDRELTKAVSFPYTVETNTTLYAGWKKRFYLNFDTGGGSAVGRARLPVGGVYDIIQGSAREGYIFAGWFDSPEGGYPVRSINADDVGSDITVYARWITDTAERMVLDCAALDQEDITADKTVSGYTIHASSGMLGDTKLFMTAKENMLYTNGVLLTDTSIPGNENGLLKSIEFDAEDAGVLSVTFSLSGNPEEGKSYNLALAKKTDTGMSETEVRSITLGKTLVTETFEIAGAGTYYLYAKGDKGVRYSLISFGKKTCALCFATGGGTLPEGLSDRVVELGETVHLKSCEPPAGYVFTGWTIDGTAFLGEDYLVKAEDVVNGVVTIKAVFEEMPDDPYLPDLPAKEDLSVTMLPGEVRRLSISRIGQYFYGVGWEVTYPKGETSRNFITVKNGVVTAKKLKKGTEKATALVTASYRSFSCTFTVTVNGSAYENKPVTSGKKKYGINAPKSVKLALNDPKKGSKAVSVSIPSQLRKADAEVSYAILTPDGQDYSGLTSGFVCDCASAGYNVPDRTKASKALFNLKALDAGSALIRWSMKDQEQETVAYTAVFVSKPLESLTSSENSLNLSVGEGARLIVTGTAGNTDPKDLSFSVKMTKGKGIKVSKSGFVTALSPGAAGEITIKLGKVAIKTPVKVTVSDWPSGSPVSPLTVNKTSVSVKAPKSGKAAKTAVLKIATPKKAADRPKSVKWVLTDYPEDAKAKVTVSGGTITVPAGASPGCYTVTLSASDEDAEKGYNTASCELIVR